MFSKLGIFKAISDLPTINLVMGLSETQIGAIKGYYRKKMKDQA